jgi:hypothetical protein
MPDVQPWQLFKPSKGLHMLQRNKHRNPHRRGHKMLLFRMLFEPKAPQPANQPYQANADASINHLLLLCTGRA